MQILYCMPISWQRQLALLYFRSRGLDNTHEGLLEAMVQFWQPNTFYNVCKLAQDELNAIVHLDKEVVDQHRFAYREPSWILEQVQGYLFRVIFNKTCNLS